MYANERRGRVTIITTTPVITLPGHEGILSYHATCLIS